MIYTVGEMAQKLGVPASTLRYYDKEGSSLFHHPGWETGPDHQRRRADPQTGKGLRVSSSTLVPVYISFIFIHLDQLLYFFLLSTSFLPFFS